jgi:hypothetical protein
MPLYIELTAEQEEALRRLAESSHRSVEDVIGEWVQKLVEESADIDWQIRKARALGAVGRFRSGHQNISEQHDQYLAEEFDR